MRDVLILAPANQQAIYQGLSEELSAIENPLWAGMLSSALTKKGKSVELIDCQFEYSLPSELAATSKLVIIPVYGQQPSASSQTMHAAQELCREIKELSDLPILLVGPHVSALPEESKRKTGADYVAVGEGLITALNILDGTNYPEVKAENIEETYPGWGYESLYMDRYRAHNWHALGYDSREGYASIYSSLGCPFKCSFCMINTPFGGPGFRWWSPDHVVNKVWELVEFYGVKHLKWADEMFVLREDHFMGIAEGIIKAKIKVNSWAYARVDTVKPKYLDTLKKAGFNWLALGIESGSQHVRDGVEKGKRINGEGIARVVEDIRNAGINIIGNYIFGLPDDTQESMAETLEMAISLNTEFANFYSAMAYPGSALFNQTKPEELPETYVGYSQHSFECRPLPTRTCTAAEVLRFRDEAHKRYFSNPDYLNMIQRKFGESGLQMINAMNKKVIKRKLYDG